MRGAKLLSEDEARGGLWRRSASCRTGARIIVAIRSHTGDEYKVSK